MRWFDTPHMPHGWDCGLMMDSTTHTFFCGDLFTQGGKGEIAITESDIFVPSEAFRAPMENSTGEGACSPASSTSVAMPSSPAEPPPRSTPSTGLRRGHSSSWCLAGTGAGAPREPCGHHRFSARSTS